MNIQSRRVFLSTMESPCGVLSIVGRSILALDKSKDQVYYDDIKMISNQFVHHQVGLCVRAAGEKEDIVWKNKVNFRKRRN